MAELAFPYRVDTRHRTATTSGDAHLRDLVEQVLFTAPGERVNRPTFGCGLAQLVFSGNSEELATAIQFLVQGALQQWLGELLQVEFVDASAVDSTLTVAVTYVVRRTAQRHVEQFIREV